MAHSNFFSNARLLLIEFSMNIFYFDCKIKCVNYLIAGKLKIHDAMKMINEMKSLRLVRAPNINKMQTLDKRSLKL